MKNNQDNKDVVSVWGRISRRELFGRLAGASLAFGLTAFETAQAQSIIEKSDIINAPYNPLIGQPFREFTPPKGLIQDFFKNTPAKSDGKKRPRFRRRDSFWYSKPNSALGVDLYQYTQSPSHLSDSCAQAALATLIHKYKVIPDGLTGDAVTDRIYQTHRPDQTAGTTVPVLVKAIKDYGLDCWNGYGAEHGEYTIRTSLRQWVAAGYPCIVLLDMRYPTGRTSDAFFAHYVVVFAYDEDEANGHVYMSNWDYKNWGNSWTVFKKAWSLPDYPARSYPLIMGWR